ncbi:MAG: AtzG-like protein [Alphaproteobacteria bacterium]
MPDGKENKDEAVRQRAEFAGLSVRPEDFPALAQGWALIQPHLTLVMAESLPPEAEPAALFRP